jgi:hypothetical protein
MDSDGHTFVTGGALGGEGIQIWDLRNLKQPSFKIEWGVVAGQSINRVMHSVKFIPGQRKLIAGCTHDIPAKCFDFARDQPKSIYDFDDLKRSCYTIDVSCDGTQVSLADYMGNL